MRTDTANHLLRAALPEPPPPPTPGAEGGIGIAAVLLPGAEVGSILSIPMYWVQYSSTYFIGRDCWQNLAVRVDPSWASSFQRCPSVAGACVVLNNVHAGTWHFDALVIGCPFSKKQVKRHRVDALL